MLTIVDHCRQDSIICKCTKLHDHSSNRKRDILCAAHAIFLNVLGGTASSLTLKKKNNYCTYWHIYIT